MNRGKPEEPYEERSREGIGRKNKQEQEEDPVEQRGEGENKPQQPRQKSDEDARTRSPPSFVLRLHGPSVVRSPGPTKPF